MAAAHPIPTPTPMKADRYWSDTSAWGPLEDVAAEFGACAGDGGRGGGDRGGDGGARNGGWGGRKRKAAWDRETDTPLTASRPGGERTAGCERERHQENYRRRVRNDATRHARQKSEERRRGAPNRLEEGGRGAGENQLRHCT